VKRVLLVANPTAQSGKNASRIERVQALFGERGIHAEPFPTLPNGATSAALTERLGKGDHSTVVAMGGDGTFREVASGIVGSGYAPSVAMGFLPTGTANDQGKSFGMSATVGALARNVDVIALGHETKLDAGVIEPLDERGGVLGRTLFFDSAGWGLSARVLFARNRDREIVAKLGVLKELYRDHLVYAGALLRTFLEAQVVDDKFTAVVDVDGASRTFHGLTDLVIKATRFYGGAWVFDPTSRHDDGEFELVVFRGKREWLSKAITDLEGNPVTSDMLAKVGVEHSKPIRGSRFEILLAQEGVVPIAAQIDGEEHERSYHTRVTVLRQALRLIVPSEGPGEIS
jgi:diacylglycerol kinase family enzyme